MTEEKEEEEEEEEPDLEVLTVKQLKELLVLCGQPHNAAKKEALIEKLTNHGNEASRARTREMIAEIERTAAAQAVRAIQMLTLLVDAAKLSGGATEQQAVRDALMGLEMKVIKKVAKVLRVLKMQLVGDLRASKLKDTQEPLVDRILTCIDDKGGGSLGAAIVQVKTDGPLHGSLEWQRVRSQQCLLHDNEERIAWRILEEGDDELKPFEGEKDQRKMMNEIEDYRSDPSEYQDIVTEEGVKIHFSPREDQVANAGPDARMNAAGESSWNGRMKMVDWIGDAVVRYDSQRVLEWLRPKLPANGMRRDEFSLGHLLRLLDRYCQYHSVTAVRTRLEAAAAAAVAAAAAAAAESGEADEDMPALIEVDEDEVSRLAIGYRSATSSIRARCTYGEVGQHISTGVHADAATIKAIKAASKAKGARARSIWQKLFAARDATDGSDDVTGGKGATLNIKNQDNSLRMQVRCSNLGRAHTPCSSLLASARGHGLPVTLLSILCCARRLRAAQARDAPLQGAARRQHDH